MEPENGNGLAGAMRELADELRAERLERQRLASTVELLQQAVGRYVVVLERQLASNDDAKRRATRHVTKSPLVTDAMREEVRRNMRKAAAR